MAREYVPTPVERRIMRQALGLDDHHSAPHRNRYYAEAASPIGKAWAALCRRGWARRELDDNSRLLKFVVTETGAAHIGASAKGRLP